MRGKYKRKKQRRKALLAAKSPVPSRIDQKLPGKPELAKQGNEDKEKPMRFVELIKNDPKFRVEVAAAVIGILVLVVYAFQLYAMLNSNRLTREAINNNKQQFQIDQRPYLWTTVEVPKLFIKAGERMAANIELADYGKAPALRCTGSGKIFFGPHALQEADAWFARDEGKYINYPEGAEFPIVPGIPSVIDTSKTDDASKSIGKGKVVDEAEKFGGKTFTGGFGGGGMTTVMSDQVLNPWDVQYILHNDHSAAIVLRLQYFDGFGNFYWSTVCESTFSSGAIPYCHEHNEIH